MFTGSHQLTVDDKGRLAVPVRVRQQLSEKYQGLAVFMAEGLDNSVEIYPASVFLKLAEDIQALENRKHADYLKKYFIGTAVDTEIDKQGRVLLPQNLREYAKLESEVRVVGQITRFDVWSERVWREARDEAKTADKADAFAALLRR